METQLSDVLFKEINLNKTRDDCSFPIKAIGKIGEKSKCKGTKIKMETLLYNLNKVINKSDIARVDYTKGGYKPNLGNGLEPLNDLFSDNILVYCPIPDNLVDKFTDTLKEEDDEEDKGLTKITNRSLIKIAQQLLASITANIKGIFNLCGIPINKPDIKPIAVVACKDSFIHKPSKYVQVLKVNMSCASLTDVFNLFTEHSKTLEDNNIFIHDIDFTRDYKGLFNKTELVDHLINNCGFRKENTYNDSDTTIIANSNTVSKNCLTFIKTVEGNGTIRYKFYNKFVQSMESPSVRNRVGSHINDWCNNPELELNRAINNSLETGILRLEITFYRYDTDKPLTKEFVTEQMDYLENLVSGERNPEVIYYNSIENQFNNLCDNILYNICLLDIDSKMAFVSLYHNSLTGKTNGFYIKDATSTKLSNALRYYTSKKPIIVVLIQQDKNNGIVSIQQDTYIKINTSGEDITTYLTTGSEFLHGIGIKDNITAKQPKEVGLIPNSTFNFAIPDKVASLIRSPNKNTCPYMFKSIPFTLLDYPNETLTIRSINKIIKEESNAEQFAENNKDKLEEIKAKNKEIAEELAKQQEEIAEEIALQKYIESNKNKLYTILKSIRCNT